MNGSFLKRKANGHIGDALNAFPSVIMDMVLNGVILVTASILRLTFFGSPDRLHRYDTSSLYSFLSFTSVDRILALISISILPSVFAVSGCSLWWCPTCPRGVRSRFASLPGHKIGLG